jgi:DNA repair exonuclease SbcCD ATPase subunit
LSAADLKCPVCSRTLDATEHDDVAKRLEKDFSQKYRDQLKKGRQENAAMLAKFKQRQRKQIQAMAKRYQNEKKMLQKRLADQTKKSRQSQKRELAQLRHNYQMQLEHMRDFYSSQNAALQNELKTSFAAQLEGMKKNYEGLAVGNQRQLETLQQYIEDKLVGELKEKVSRLEQEKMSSDLRLSEMVQELDQRNAEVVSLKEQLNQIDTAVQEEHAPEIQNESLEQGNSQQELIKMVKEVAEQRELDLQELEEDNPGDEEEKHGFWGSKSGKRFGLF